MRGLIRVMSGWKQYREGRGAGSIANRLDHWSVVNAVIGAITPTATLLQLLIIDLYHYCQYIGKM